MSQNATPDKTANVDQARAEDDASLSKTSTSIEVNVPLTVAYNQWTQFEEYPQFMSAVQSVEQIKDDLVHWKVSIAGHTVEYDAQILEQVPDSRIVWQSVNGRETGGAVSFERVADGVTKVTLQLTYAPEGPLEKLGDLVDVVGRQAKADLAKFKTFIEARGYPTGQWRGEIE